ncbi:hypothetical protein EO087_10040 [Dyella sp. M7H15-1]|uniref:flagellar export chaperone FlgN n=1 Tax=Dyella sp. M7H15-1 TaxID=2501295 RepID=UPI001004E7E1|nr:flagellar export chaperone FlgN [Dyella sp. M7H15-1]QAU24288.1 hypothetical protein EO087_10040 [Dyella sp. M7H15-1]
MLKRALEDLDSELAAYRKLSGMLDEQFQTAKRLDTTSLVQVGDAIAQEVARLDQRRRARMQLLHVATTLANRLPAAKSKLARQALEKRCAELKQLAMQCKASTLRNGQLLASQYDIMQRVLRGEQHTYAPG